MFTLNALLFLAMCQGTPNPPQANPYLEIPLEGRFGTQITARGLEESLMLAKTLGVKHVVFSINSPGGDPQAEGEIRNLLSRFDPTFQFHAVVREATGVAALPLVCCETILIRPGGKIGAVKPAFDEAQYQGMETRVVLANLALNLGEEAKRHGHSAELVRAMMDPAEALYGWRDSSGRVQISGLLPNGVHSDDFILKHPAGSVLTLTDRQAVELRFARPFDGSVADLGCELGFVGWASKGDAGRAVMAQATLVEQTKAATSTNWLRQHLIDQNRSQRIATKAAIEHSLGLAQRWDPRFGTYSTHKESGVCWGGFGAGGYESGRLTPEARQKWQDRSDFAMTELSKALSGVNKMRILEKQARDLGQKAFYPEERLDQMRLDITLHIAELVQARDNRFRDDHR
jgi:hypothetical protein